MVKLKMGMAWFLLVTTLCGQERVGILSDLNRIRFEGLKSYSRDAVISGLLLTEEFRSAIHPTAPREVLVGRLSDSVKALLLHAGHADVEVKAELDWLTDGIIVRVTEGPLYKPGEIVVTGVEADLARLVENSLRSLGVLGWSDKGRASFDPETLGELESVAKKALIAEGYHSAKIRLSRDADPDAMEVKLLVEVQELGRRLRLKNIVWEGEIRSSREAILEALDISEGMFLRGDLVAEIHQALDQIANFPVYQARLSGDPSQEDLQLRLYLEEDDWSTVLGEPRSEKELAFERAGEWLSAWEAQDYDIETKVESARGSRAQLVLSGPDWSFLFQQMDEDGSLRDRVAVLVSSTYVGLYDYGREMKFGFRPTGFGFKSFIEVTHDATPGIEAKNRNGFVMGGGLLKGEDSLIEVDVTISQAAFRDLAGKHRGIGDGVFDGPDGSRVGIDIETGRLLRIWKPGPNEGYPEISTRLGAKAELDRYVAETTQGFNESSNLGELIETFSTLLRSSRLEGVEPLIQKVEPYLSGIDQLSVLLKSMQWTFWEPLGEFVTDLDGPKNPLLPPPSLLGGEGGLSTVYAQALGSVAYMLMGRINDLFPAGTWPSLLASEAIYVSLGETDRFGETINEVMEGFNSGPLAHWIIVSYLSSRGVPASSMVANRGMMRLSPGRVRQEINVLTRGKAVFPLVLRTLVKDLEQLPVPQFPALAQGKLGPELALIQTLRRHPTNPEDGKLSEPVLDGLSDYFVQRWLPRIVERLNTARFDRFRPDGRAFKAGKGVWIRGYKPLGPEDKPPVPYVMRLVQGRINGTSVEGSSPEIEVEAGRKLKGSIVMDLLATHSGSDVFPIGATWTWAEDPGSAVQVIHGSLVPGLTRFEIPVDLKAPEKPGTYYLVYTGGRGETSEQVLAGEGASPRPDPGHCVDGNEVARWSVDQCEAAISRGFVGSNPATCLRIHVRSVESENTDNER